MILVSFVFLYFFLPFDPHDLRFGSEEVRKARECHPVLGAFFDGHECLALRGGHEVRCLVDETIRRLSERDDF